MRSFSAENPNPIKDSHKFGNFSFDTAKRVLWRNGELVYLPPRSADLLAVLLENRGEVLERNELIDRVWKDTFVEEGNLNYTISILRKALGANENGENFIQTIPRRGYRFRGDPRSDADGEVIYEKHSLTETVIEEIHTSAPEVTTVPMTQPRSATLARVGIAVLSVLTVVISAVALAMTWRSSTSATATTARGVKSIAVLPFRSANDNAEHRGLGLADIVITRLGGMAGISVRPTSAVMAFENKDVDAIQVGQELQADAVLDGMIHRTSDSVHVTARLVRVADGASLWSGVFEKPLSDELSVESEIVAQLANALVLNQASTNASGGGPYTNNPDAYQLYVRGRYEWNKRDQLGLHEAERLFRNAIAADPNFALAYVGLADSLVFDAETQELNDAIAKALALDPELGEAYATYAFTLALHQWKWKESEENFKKAIELRPGYATAHQWYAVLLGIEGRTQEAETEMKRALEINPLSHNFIADLGEVYYFQRDYEKAEEYCRRALEIYPEFPFAHGHLRNLYERTGRYELAIDEMVTTGDLNARSVSKGVPKKSDNLRAQYLGAYEKGGFAGYVSVYKQLNEEIAGAGRNPNGPYGFAAWYSLLGEKEKALDHLEEALERRAFLMAWVKADPRFDELRSEPRYQAILRKMGLS